MIKRRPRKSVEQWKAVIADQQASSLSRVDYYLKHDIHIDTFSARLSDINRGLNGRSNKVTNSIDMSRKTLSDWMLRCVDRLQIVYNRLKVIQLAQPVIHADETTLNVVSDDNVKSYMWVHATGADSPKDKLADSDIKPKHCRTYYLFSQRFRRSTYIN